MNIAEDQWELEKVKAEQIIADTPLMDGIDRITVELGEDQTGDPALWLVCQMRPGVARVRALNERIAKQATAVLEGNPSPAAQRIVLAV